MPRGAHHSHHFPLAHGEGEGVIVLAQTALALRPRLRRPLEDTAVGVDGKGRRLRCIDQIGYRELLLSELGPEAIHCEPTRHGLRRRRVLCLDLENDMRPARTTDVYLRRGCNCHMIHLWMCVCAPVTA